MVSNRPLISNSSSPSTIFLMILSSAPFTTGITVASMFNHFFQFLSQEQVLIFLLAFFQFYSVICRDSKVNNMVGSLLLLTIIRTGRLAEVGWSVCLWKSQKSFCVSFSITDSGLYINHLFVWWNFNFLHSFQWSILPYQSCLALYSFRDNFLHSLIMWLIVSSNRHLLFCYVVSILAFIWLVLIALFCAAVRRHLVFLLRFASLNHLQVFSCAI